MTMPEQITNLPQAAAPKSDQLNADDLICGPMTVTVDRVVRGPGDQAVEIKLHGGHKPYRPCKTMSRVLASLWGPDPSQWAHPSRLTLYRDPTVTWGRIAVGGIRISHMSGIARPTDVVVTKSRTVRIIVTILPLADEPASTDGQAALDDVLHAAGLTAGDCARWLDANGQSVSNDQERAQLARYLTANPDMLDAIRAATSTVSGEGDA